MMVLMQRVLFLFCCVCSLSRSLRHHRSANQRLQLSMMSSIKGASPASKSVGFIGLGLMGDGMARRLLSNEFPLTVWNRSKPKCDSLKTDFESLVYVAESPAEVISRSDITFVMLSTPEATRNVYEGPSGMLSALKKGKSIVDCATLAPEDMIWASKEVNQRGGLFVEGPVSGSKIPAEKGQLIFLLAGDQSLVNEIQPHLAQMGKANHFIGTEAGTATRMKLVVNAIMSNMLACLGEGMSLTADCGLSVDMLLQILGQGTMASPLISVKGPKIMAKDYEANFPLKHAYKDLSFAVDLAAQKSSKVPMSIAARQVYADAMKSGSGDLDFSSMAEEFLSKITPSAP